MQKTTPSLNGRRIADLSLFRTLLAIHQKSREPSFWKVILCYFCTIFFFFFLFFFLPDASLAASRILLKRLLACLNFTLEPEDLSFWYKRKKWFLWTMKPAQAAENHGDQWGLTWYFLSGLYTSTAEALSLKISSHRTALKWPWRPSQSALQYS